VPDPQEITNGNGDLLVQAPDLEIEEDLDDDLAPDAGDPAEAEPADELEFAGDDLDLAEPAPEPEHVSPTAIAGDLDLGADLPATAPAGVAVLDDGASIDDRLARLEAAAQALADAELRRDGRRVKRKVKAATGGAGLAAVIPVILQLTGAMNLSPELASGIAAAAALIGAFAGGWSTPEREPSLPAGVVTPAPPPVPSP
jgi:hypothetical protein